MKLPIVGKIYKKKYYIKKNNTLKTIRVLVVNHISGKILVEDLDTKKRTIIAKKTFYYGYKLYELGNK